MAELQGMVRWFNNVKGYGFLGQDDGPDKLSQPSLVQSAGYKSLEEGEPVEYDLRQGVEAPEAGKIKRLKRD